MLVKILNTSKINKQATESIYNKLLTGQYKARLTIYIGRDKKDTYNIDVDFLGNDCCINSWSLNFYIRTNKAVKNERYKTLGYCLAALKRLANKNNIKIISNLRIYKTINFKFSDGTKDFYNCHLFSIEL